MRIGEFAETAGTTTKTLRFYEDQGLLPPTERPPAGYRDSVPAAAARLPRSAKGGWCVTLW